MPAKGGSSGRLNGGARGGRHAKPTRAQKVSAGRYKVQAKRQNNPNWNPFTKKFKGKPKPTGM